MDEQEGVPFRASVLDIFKKEYPGEYNMFRDGW